MSDQNPEKYIHVRNLKKSFRVHQKEPGLQGSIRSLFRRNWIERDALKGIDLDVYEGEILGMVGANGAGKTTLVKSLAGIIYPTSGEASVLGYTPWERKNEFRRQIALIMGQKAQLWWDLPAADCFILLKEIYRIPEPLYRRNLEYLTESLGVEHILKIQIRRLSLGERMKMELIAALLHNPKIVFLDEPTIGLDLTAQRAIRSFILEYRKEHRPAMILTSHYMEDIERLCERIVIIREGDLVYDGSLERIVKQYARHKIVTVRLSGKGTPFVVSEFPESLGEVIESTDEYARILVDRERIPQAAQVILAREDILDMNIEEEDIGNVIEAIMKRGSEL